MTQIGEHVRTHLVEIVRTTFSTLLRNYRLENPQLPIHLSTVSESHLPRSSSSGQMGTQNARLEDTANTGLTERTRELAERVRGPFPSTTTASMASPGPSHDLSLPTSYVATSADSVSINLASTCECSCHRVLNPINAVYGERISSELDYSLTLMLESTGKQSCQECSWMHLDPHSLDMSGLEDVSL